MSGLLRALGDVGTSKVGESRVPDEVLGAMELTPVPVGAHNSTNESRVILMRGPIVNEIARLDIVGWSRDRRGSRKGDEGRNNPHAELLTWEKLDRCRKLVESGFFR